MTKLAMIRPNAGTLIDSPTHFEGEAADQRGEGDDGQRNEQRAAHRIAADRRALGHQPLHRDHHGDEREREREQARRGAGAEREAAHAGEIAAGPEGDEREA